MKSTTSNCGCSFASPGATRPTAASSSGDRNATTATSSGIRPTSTRPGTGSARSTTKPAAASLQSAAEKTTVSADGEKTTEQVADAAELFRSVKQDDWNDYSITARGEEITLKVNGNVTAQVDDRQSSQGDLIGLLALQLHSGPPMKIEFRNLRLKRFPLEDRKKVVFVAGTPSHGYFSHEHNAGCLLLSKALNESREEHGLAVVSTVYTNGWPKDPTAFDNADTVVSYCDGGGRHYLNDRLDDFQRLVDERGVGLACIHYAVETTKGECGDHFLDWIGGFFEPHWSVNPHWTAGFDDLPEHPITRGVAPFEINDEWYYHMRFQPEMAGVTPILTDMPPRETLSRPDGPHSGNPYVREAVLQRKEPQHVAWAYERPGGKGRGFGFTGGHFHKNWQNDSFPQAGAQRDSLDGRRRGAGRGNRLAHADTGRTGSEPGRTETEDGAAQAEKT